MKPIVLFLALSIVSVYALAAEPKEVVVLKQGIRLNSQMVCENTIYRVSSSFDLDGDELIIPDKCVLYFDGGSIVNGTIVFSNTELAGYPQIRCKLKGTIPKADISWFGAERDNLNLDVGSIINQVQAITNHIIIPAGLFFQTTEPIRIEGSKFIDWVGTIVTIGNAKQFDAFTITSGTFTLDMKGALICKSKEIRYDKKKQTEITGLVVENVYNSTISISSISGFNTGLKVFGYGKGCSYNLFNLRSIRDCNTGLLITQRNKNGKIGWANENTFIGGRFGVSSSWDTNERETHAVVARSIYQDDTYNRVNSLYFLRPCVEGDFIPFVLHNALMVTVEDCRTEGGRVGAKLSGACNKIQMSNSFGTSLNNIDISELTRNQSSPLFAPKMYAKTRKTLSFDVRDVDKGVVINESFRPKGLVGHYSYKGIANVKDCPIYKNDVSEIGTEVVFEKTSNILSRLMNVSIPQNSSGERRYIYLIVKETFDGNAIDNNDIVFSQSMFYNEKGSYWVSGVDIDETQIIVGENVKTVAVVFKNVSGFSISVPNSASIGVIKQ